MAEGGICGEQSVEPPPQQAPELGWGVGKKAPAHPGPPGRQRTDQSQGTCSGHATSVPSSLHHICLPRASSAPCRAASAPGDSHQGKGHTCQGGQAEAYLGGLSEVFSSIHIQAKSQCTQDPKHDEESPTETRKLLEEEQRGR
jgi:hypothetical protein